MKTYNLYCDESCHLKNIIMSLIFILNEPSMSFPALALNL
jgi:hypothetical protein